MKTGKNHRGVIAKPTGWIWPLDLPDRGAKALRSFHRNVRPAMPKCGALARTTGEPCQQLPLENGRCRLHGGLTPKGKDWHRLKSTGDPAKDARKLRDHERRLRERALRLEKMTPEERAAYDRWLETHCPTSPADRARRREERRRDREARELLAKLAVEPPSGEPGLESLQAALSAHTPSRDTAETSSAAEDAIHFEGLTEGVFG